MPETYAEMRARQQRDAQHQHQLHAKTQTIHELYSQIGRLQLDTSHLEGELKKKAVELECANSTIELQRNRIEELSEKLEETYGWKYVAELEKKNEELREELALADGNAAALGNVNWALERERARADRAEKEKDGLAIEVAALKSQAEYARKRHVQDLKDALDSFKSMADDLTIEIHALEDIIEDEEGPRDGENVTTEDSENSRGLRPESPRPATMPFDPESCLTQAEIDAIRNSAPHDESRPLTLPGEDAATAVIEALAKTTVPVKIHIMKANAKELAEAVNRHVAATFDPDAAQIFDRFHAAHEETAR